MFNYIKEICKERKICEGELLCGHIFYYMQGGLTVSCNDNNCPVLKALKEIEPDRKEITRQHCAACNLKDTVKHCLKLLEENKDLADQVTEGIGFIKDSLGVDPIIESNNPIPHKHDWRPLNCNVRAEWELQRAGYKRICTICYSI
jgi:hypothetical protein